MPEPLRAVDNHHRHRLNQFLQQAGIDPEIRFAQLGWVASPAHATSDMSPRSARDLADELGPTLDAFLVHDGWFGASHRVPAWTWDGVPERPLKDWDAIAKSHVAEHQLRIRNIRQDLAERGREVEKVVLPRLARALVETVPQLRLDEKAKRLVRSASNPTGKVEIDAALIDLMRDRVRQRDDHPDSALEAVVVQIALHRLLKKSHREGLTAGFIPRRPILSITAEPSPFLPGLGLAVRQATALRSELIARAAMHKPHDQGALSVLLVLGFTPYRDVKLARAAASCASEAQRAAQPGDWLRLPAVLDRRSQPMVLGGVAAMQLVRRSVLANSAKPPTDEEMAAWVGNRLTLPFGCPEGADTLERIGQTLKACGRVELSGPERSIMLGDITPALTTVERCVAWTDNWPVRTRPADEDLAQAFASEPVETERVPSPPNQRDVTALYGRLTSLLNPDTFPAAVGKATDSRHGWRPTLGRELAKLHQAAGSTSTIGLVIHFASHRLQFGGKRRKHLEHGTLHNNVTRFARELLQVVGHRDLMAMDGAELLGVYLSVLKTKSKSAQPETLDAIKTFHRYLAEVHQADEVSFGELASLAGQRVIARDPGLLTEAEVALVARVLFEDLEYEETRADASPDFVRMAELKIVLFLLMEAGALRTGSAFGLLLKDLHLFGPSRDFVHLHRTGGYGVIKTSASIGFVRLRGQLWEQHRDWVATWLERERASISARMNAPLFAVQAGSPRRFRRQALLDRIGDLIRWASREKKARPYWLRKRRVACCHAEVLDKADVRARDVYAVLCENGHGTIGTPLGHYIADPAIMMRRSLLEARRTPRSCVLAVSDLDVEPLDMAWSRLKKTRDAKRMVVVLDRLNIEPAASPAEQLTSPPPHRRRLQLLPRHVDTFARTLQACGDVHTARLQAGLSVQQASLLEDAAAHLLVQRGKVPWSTPGLLHSRSVMQPPRRLKGTRGLFQMLDTLPSPSLQTLAKAWAERGFVSRIEGKAGLALLMTTDERDTVEELLADRKLPPCQIHARTGSGPWLVQVLRPEIGTNADRRQRTFHAAMAWLLAMVRLQGYVASIPATGPAPDRQGESRPAMPCPGEPGSPD